MKKIWSFSCVIFVAGCTSQSVPTAPQQKLTEAVAVPVPPPSFPTSGMPGYEDKFSGPSGSTGNPLWRYVVPTIPERKLVVLDTVRPITICIFNRNHLIHFQVRKSACAAPESISLQGGPAGREDCKTIDAQSISILSAENPNANAGGHYQYQYSRPENRPIFKQLGRWDYIGNRTTLVDGNRIRRLRICVANVDWAVNFTLKGTLCAQDQVVAVTGTGCADVDAMAVSIEPAHNPSSGSSGHYGEWTTN